MPRDLPLSNGRLLVMFDREYRIRDIYYPHVGKENHGTGHVFRFGVWVGGQFSWMSAEWNPGDALRRLVDDHRGAGADTRSWGWSCSATTASTSTRTS